MQSGRLEAKPPAIGLAFSLNKTLFLSAGVLLPVFGTNEYMSVIPNFSMWYYWGSVNGLLMAR